MTTRQTGGLSQGYKPKLPEPGTKEFSTTKKLEISNSGTLAF